MKPKASVVAQKLLNLYRQAHVIIGGWSALNPIFVDEAKYGMSRDALYDKLKSNNILGRRYFYPLISTFMPYKDYPSAKPENLPVATRVAEQVLCLPMHHALSDDDVRRIIGAIANL